MKKMMSRITQFHFFCFVSGHLLNSSRYFFQLALRSKNQRLKTTLEKINRYEEYLKKASNLDLVIAV